MEHYRDDTLTNAIRNRVASRELFRVWSGGDGTSTANGIPSEHPRLDHSPQKHLLLSRPEPSQLAVAQQQQQKHQQNQLFPPPPSTPLPVHHPHAKMSSSIGNSNNSVPLEQNSSSSTTSSVPHPQQQQVFLHRSPSGAQRKIRQKAQQQQQSVSNFSAQSFSSVNSINTGGGAGRITTNQRQMPYRTLIQENDYRSLLGGADNKKKNEKNSFVPPPSNSEMEEFSLGQMIDRMRRLEPQPRMQQQPHFSALHTTSLDSDWHGTVGGCSIDKMPAAFPPSRAEQHQQPPATTTQIPPLSYGKPTVQVYPLPVPPRRSASVLSNGTCSPPIGVSKNNNKNSPPSNSPKPAAVAPPLPPKKHSLLASQPLAMPIHNRFPSLQQQKPLKLDEGWKSKNFPTTATSPAPPSSSCFPASLSHERQQKTTITGQSPSPVLSSSVIPNKEEEKIDNNSSPNFEKLDSKQQVEEKLDKTGRVDSAATTSFPHQTLFQLAQAPFFPSSSTSLPPSSSSSLSSSPSLASLQSSLHFAVENLEKHSIDQLKELEQRRLKSIESLTRKIADREQDRELLSRDLEEVEQLRASLFARIEEFSKNSALLERLRIFCAETERLAELETLLNCQRARLVDSSKNGRRGSAERAVDGTGAREEWAFRLGEQFGDLALLHSYLATRERHLDAEIADELGEAEALHEWLFCKEHLAKLRAERRLLDERLRDVRALVASLQAICLFPTPKNTEEEEENEEWTVGNENVGEVMACGGSRE